MPTENIAHNSVTQPVSDGRAAVDLAELWFTPGSAETLRRLIAEHGGNEVFCIGTLDSAGMLVDVEHLATGNEYAVPAPAQNSRPGQVLIHNHPTGNLEPSDPDINLASGYGRMGVGFFIVNNTVSAVRIVVKPFKPVTDVTVDEEKLCALIAGDEETGEEVLEHRPQQVDMMRQVVRAFTEKRILIVEAGTGTGKSYAYLAPAIEWAIANKQRVVVTTSTIPLQEQLLHKDIPALRKMMGVDVKAQVLKGRGQFVSKRRLDFAASQTSLIPTEQQNELMKLKAWAEKSADGSRSDLPFKVSDEVWDAAVSDRDDCLRSKCPHFDTCFYFQMHREAAAADIVIANHSLVMSDLALRASGNDSDFAAILPPHRAVIVDEAHNLEETASRHFSLTATELMFRRIFNQLYHTRNGAGTIRQIYELISTRHLGAKEIPGMEKLLPLVDSIIPSQRLELDNSVRYVYGALMDDVLKLMDARGNVQGDSRERDERYLRVDRDFLQSDEWGRIEALVNKLCDEVMELHANCRKALGLLMEIEDEKLRSDFENHVISLKAVSNKVEGLVGNLRSFLSADETDSCRWFEVVALRSNRSIKYIMPWVAKLDVSQCIHDGLLAQKEIVVLTSATLTVDQNFDYFARQIGLISGTLAGGEKEKQKPPAQAVLPVAERVSMFSYASPFNYRDNCKVAIPLDMPEPNAIGDDALNGPLLEMMLETIKLTHGRAMVLFTSFRAMKKSANMLGGALRSQGINVLVQGDEPRSQLLDHFRSSHAAALFATTSFWEGVDLKGNSLQMLIIHKLPFAVPTEPLAKAKAEAMVRMGQNPFMQMSLPQAVIKLKQGFGRLIRSKSDYGVVVLLDGRLLTKYYGGKFLRSLPGAEIYKENMAVLLPKLDCFFQEREGWRSS